MHQRGSMRANAYEIPSVNLKIDRHALLSPYGAIFVGLVTIRRTKKLFCSPLGLLGSSDGSVGTVIKKGLKNTHLK